MNIFCTHISPLASALHLDDVRVRKMIVESAQLLSNCIHHYARFISNYHPDMVYKPTHPRHPCSLWVQESLANATWLIMHSTYLSKIHENISNKPHKSYDIIESIQWILENNFHSLPQQFTMSEFTPFVNCTPFKHDLDRRSTTERYQHYMIQKWETDKIVVQWSNRPVPQFYVDFLNKKGRKL